MLRTYSLRPNARRCMQKRLDAHVAAFGERNRDKIVAVPSKTGQGVHLYFDPERSLSPDPERAANRQRTDSAEGMNVVEDPDSEDSLSDLGSDAETVAPGPDTPPQRRQDWSSSHPHTPKAPRHIKQENMPEGSVDSSSSVHDSLAPIAESKKALKAHLKDDVEGRRRFLEHERQMMLRQAKNDEERVAVLRREYEGQLEQFRQEHADIFRYPSEGVSVYSDPLSPALLERGDLPPEIPHLAEPLTEVPSRVGQVTQEDRKQYTPLHRHHALPLPMSPRDKAKERVRADGPFVIVARRVQKLGPCGTVVVDHETGDDKVVTKCYRVREEELQSIDGEGDSVMGSDDSSM